MLMRHQRFWGSWPFDLFYLQGLVSSLGPLLWSPTLAKLQIDLLSIAFVAYIMIHIIVFSLWRMFCFASWGNTFLQLSILANCSLLIYFLFHSFHLQCTETSLEDAVLFVCRYCDFVNSEKLPRGGYSALVCDYNLLLTGVNVW